MLFDERYQKNAGSSPDESPKGLYGRLKAVQVGK
jgi:hypothetical protein